MLVQPLLLSGVVQYWGDVLSHTKVTLLLKELTWLREYSCTQTWTVPCLQGMLQRAVTNMTAMGWLCMERSEPESKAALEGRESMGSSHGM